MLLLGVNHNDLQDNSKFAPTPNKSLTHYCMPIVQIESQKAPIPSICRCGFNNFICFIFTANQTTKVRQVED